MQYPTTQDEYAQMQRQMQEQAEAAERGRKRNIETLTRMWLSLGRDVLIAAGSQHRSEIDEALALATHRWSRLLDMENQIQREEQQLASRPKKRPAEPTDEQLPDRTIAERERAWENQTQHMRAAHAELRKLAERERRELESLITKVR
jgi:hypothetical protein